MNESKHQHANINDQGSSYRRSISTPGGVSAAPTPFCVSAAGGGGHGAVPSVAAVSASDAVESLLLLGQKPVLSGGQEQPPPPASNGIERSSTFPGASNRFKINNCGPGVNYYQMRMRNNEASKRCRLKRRIKQESLDKTLILLERNKSILGQRVARLNKIKTLLSEACREFNSKSDGGCSCISYCKSIWDVRDDFEGKRDISNLQLVKESRILRNTNIEEILTTEISTDTLRPMRRGPRKQEDIIVSLPTTTVKNINGTSISLNSSTVNNKLMSGNLEGPAKVISEMLKTVASDPTKCNDGDRSFEPQMAEETNTTFQGALDLSSSSRNASSKPTNATPIPPKIQLPKAAAVVGASTNNIQLAKGGLAKGGISGIVIDAGGMSPKHLPLLAPKPQFQVESISNCSSSSKSSVYNNTIILTPISSSLPPTILNLPALSSRTSFSLDSLPPSPPTLSIAEKTEHKPSIVERMDPTLSIVEKMEPEEIKMEPEIIETDSCLQLSQNCETSEIPFETDARIEKPERDGIRLSWNSETESSSTEVCVAAKKGQCSGELMDLNALNQTLDLLTMKPRQPGALTAAEKYVIMSRLGLPYWNADERAAYICSQHRTDIIVNVDTSSCSLCSRKHKKGSGPMNVITYRIGLMYYMTQGKFLEIGTFVCQHCRQRSLKGLDFNDSVAVEPEREDERKVWLPNNLISSTTKTSNLAAIQPVPKATLKTPVASVSQESLLTKIERLNDSIQAVNPRFKPLGFSITNLESLSPGVLQDTLTATQTALHTILSSIAPGQEYQLWEAVKPCLDAALPDNKPTNHIRY